MRFTLTPAHKGNITKRLRKLAASPMGSTPQLRYHTVRAYFAQYMPMQQAKHATKRYLYAYFLMPHVLEAAPDARTGRFTSAKPNRAGVPKACDMLVQPGEEYVTLTFMGDGTPVVLHA